MKQVISCLKICKQLRVLDYLRKHTYLQDGKNNFNLPGCDINIDGSRCPDKTAQVNFISSTLDIELTLCKWLDSSADLAGTTYTSDLCFPPSESYKKKVFT